MTNIKNGYELLVGKTSQSYIIPKLIIREKTSINVASFLHKKSTEPKTLEHFTLNNIRISLADNVNVDQESRKDFTKKLNLQSSMRVSSLLFLALNYDYSQLSRIIIVSHQHKDVVKNLEADLKVFYPRAEFLTFAENSPNYIYEDRKTAESGEGRLDGKITYLLSLGSTLEHHRDLVQYFHPHHALMGIDTSSKLDFQFYDGELWIPPFGGSLTKILYIRSKFRSDQYDFDPLRTGSIWDGKIINNALVNFRTNTNENVVYFNPMTGTDTYLFHLYLNDYSHLFAYYTIKTFYEKLGKTVSEEMFQKAFECCVGLQIDRKSFIHEGQVVYAAGILFRTSDKILCVEEIEKSSGNMVFSDPGGKANSDDKTIEETASREFYEEIEKPADMDKGIKKIIYIPIAKYLLYVVICNEIFDSGKGKWVEIEQFKAKVHSRLKSVIHLI